MDGDLKCNVVVTPVAEERLSWYTEKSTYLLGHIAECKPNDGGTVVRYTHYYLSLNKRHSSLANKAKVANLPYNFISKRVVML